MGRAPGRRSGALKLLQPRAAKTLQVMLAVGGLFYRQFACDPGERDIGLSAAKLLQGCSGEFTLSGHSSSGGQDTVPADEIEASVRSSIEAANQPEDFQFTVTQSRLASFKVS